MPRLRFFGIICRRRGKTSDGVVTKYLYATDAVAGLETRTTIRAFGTGCAVTNTTVSYADGRTKETLLNGVVKTAYEYGPRKVGPGPISGDGFCAKVVVFCELAI